MNLRTPLTLAVLTVLSLGIWRSQLFTVSRPGERPEPLVARELAQRPPANVDVVLPAVPVGMVRLRGGDGVTIVHYWAPWERNGRLQAVQLDSLRKAPGFESVRIRVVCFDPFPSVARFVGRNRLGLSVLLDHGPELRSALPCPSIPYTYVLDSAGRIAVAQAGEVDWFAERTLRTLRALAGEPRGSSATPS